MQTIPTLFRVTLFLLAIAATACAAAATPTVPPTQASTATAAPTIVPTLVPTVAPTTASTTVSTTAPTASVANDSVLTANGAFFALSVADAAASAEWYQDKLGLKIVLEPPKTTQSTVIVLEGGGLIVELIQSANSVSLSAAAPAVNDKFLVHGIVKVGVIVQDFDQTIATLKERNVPFLLGPFPKRPTQRANVIIEDNAGNLIQFFGN